MALVGFEALDWFLRTYCPLWLDAIGARAAATDVRALKPIVDETGFNTARAMVLGAINAAWEGTKALAGPKMIDVAAHYQSKGVAIRGGFESMERAMDAAKIARVANAPPAALIAWRRASLLVAASGGTQALDSLAMSVALESGKVQLG